MKGYSRIPKKILYSLPSGKELLIYAILSYLNVVYGKGNYVRISYSKLAKLSSLSHSSVARAVKTLSSLHLLKVLPARNHDKQCGNRYLCAGLNCKNDYVTLPLSLLGKCGSEKILVYVYLKSFTNSRKVCYISQRQLSEKAGISRTTIRKYISVLEHDGLICMFDRSYKETKAKRSFVYIFANVDEEAYSVTDIDIGELGEICETRIAVGTSFVPTFGFFAEICDIRTAKPSKKSRVPP